MLINIINSYADEQDFSLYSIFQVDEPAQYKSNAPDTYRYVFNEITEHIYAYNEICIMGSILVSFIVNTDGQLEHIKVIKNDIAGVIENDTIEQIFVSMGKWVPAKYDGVPVRTLVVYPIVFQQ